MVALPRQLQLAASLRQRAAELRDASQQLREAAAPHRLTPDNTPHRHDHIQHQHHTPPSAADSQHQAPPRKPAVPRFATRPKSAGALTTTPPHRRRNSPTAPDTAPAGGGSAFLTSLDAADDASLASSADVAALRSRLTSLPALSPTDRFSSVVDATVAERGAKIREMVRRTHEEDAAAAGSAAAAGQRERSALVRELDGLRRLATRKGNELRRLATDAREMRLLGTVANQDELLERAAALECSEAELAASLNEASDDSATLEHMRQRYLDQLRAAQRRNDSARAALARATAEVAKLMLGMEGQRGTKIRELASVERYRALLDDEARVRAAELEKRRAHAARLVARRVPAQRRNEEARAVAAEVMRTASWMVKLREAMLTANKQEARLGLAVRVERAKAMGIYDVDAAAPDVPKVEAIVDQFRALAVATPLLNESKVEAERRVAALRDEWRRLDAERREVMLRGRGAGGGGFATGRAIGIGALDGSDGGGGGGSSGKLSLADGMRTGEARAKMADERLETAHTRCTEAEKLLRHASVGMDALRVLVDSLAPAAVVAAVEADADAPMAWRRPSERRESVNALGGGHAEAMASAAAAAAGGSPPTVPRARRGSVACNLPGVAEGRRGSVACNLPSVAEGRRPNSAQSGVGVAAGGGGGCGSTDASSSGSHEPPLATAARQCVVVAGVLSEVIVQLGGLQRVNAAVKQGGAQRYAKLSRAMEAQGPAAERGSVQTYHLHALAPELTLPSIDDGPRVTRRASLESTHSHAHSSRRNSQGSGAYNVRVALCDASTDAGSERGCNGLDATDKGHDARLKRPVDDVDESVDWRRFNPRASSPSKPRCAQAAEELSVDVGSESGGDGGSGGDRKTPSPANKAIRAGQSFKRRGGAQLGSTSFRRSGSSLYSGAPAQQRQQSHEMLTSFMRRAGSRPTLGKGSSSAEFMLTKPPRSPEVSEPGRLRPPSLERKASSAELIIKRAQSTGCVSPSESFSSWGKH